MKLSKRSRTIIIQTAILFGIIVVGGIGIFVVVYLPSIGLMIPQDCILVRRDIRGIVQDRSGQTIADADIHIYTSDARGFEAGKVDLSLKTDKSGSFSTDGVYAFACQTLFFQVTASGYAKKRLEFWAAQEPIAGGDPEGYGRPDDKVSSSMPVLPRQIVIEMP